MPALHHGWRSRTKATGALDSYLTARMLWSLPHAACHCTACLLLHSRLLQFMLYYPSAHSVLASSSWDSLAACFFMLYLSRKIRAPLTLSLGLIPRKKDCTLTLWLTILVICCNQVIDLALERITERLRAELKLELQVCKRKRQR